MEYITDLVMELQRRENVDLPRFKEQLDETEKAISNMLNAIQQGIFNKSTKERLDELEAQKDELELKIAQEETVYGRLTKTQVSYWLHRFRKLDTEQYEHRQQLVDTFLNAVYVYDDRVIIAFNGRDGTETLTLEEIGGSDLASPSVPNQKPGT